MIVTVLSRIVDPSVAVVIPPAAAAFPVVVVAPVVAAEAVFFFFGNASTLNTIKRSTTKETALSHDPVINAIFAIFQHENKIKTSSVNENSNK